ncbi:MAG: 2-C-methyl-D-erythritol 2,4-cyclodiphosphate synthase [Pelagibacteraceae bacterium]|nr:2-C-methyl-D-erythritol 2,4-cyclodiphosphate synthase [Pelagibacteraceae bacterium]|tara:strand:- start:39104 stop:40222 length:1119 start_codon:yes stop_codon:yes gene_type:complete
MKKVGFVILAGGEGKRFGSIKPKQFVEINNHNSIEIILDEILKNKLIDKIVIVINNKYRNEISIKKPNILFATSGSTRQESSLNGLKKIKKYKYKKVIIHDGCRPYINNSEINKIIKLLDHYDGCAPLIKNVDLVRIKKGKNYKEINNKFYLTQTPQGFKFNKILKENINNRKFNSKDDIKLLNNNSYKIKFFEGNKNNIKITYKKDLKFFNFKKNKYGIGYDIHRFNFNSNKKLKLCGVKIDHYPLKGHSDADVGYHALCDSIFGALGLNDIGIVFKNTNPKWKNANSEIFLKYAKNKLEQSGAEILNIDINFICEKPKISKYSKQMKENISKILNIKNNIISIKATTNEKIGFIGNGDGIAAEAIISINL